ncbi:response regulator transcription factor [Ferroacidibacillus organovorans]|uniref:Two-component system response regulator n=1 Tax=Ferroacidibacillus organovorans TaxID=1765683 RepID=A0A101XP44_9BACL|nr:response regulator transcription factor [Ferroacidibacillus organovorans]KUO94807.1 two-component system response regulator [Ferroacidibacillus organovorans]
MRLLLIEDEVRLAKALQQTFSEHHYIVDLAHDGATGLDLAQTDTYDIILVDVMLPNMSGYEVVRKLRKTGHATPILMLTARDAVDDRVEGLDAGADDYLVKPFATKELLARVRALSRRSGEMLDVEEVSVGAISIDSVSRSVYVAGEPYSLTGKEFQLLELFMRNPNQVLPKELILDRVWGVEAPMDRNAVEIYVHFLRKKMDKVRIDRKIELAEMPVIETVRGVGYALRGGK